MLGERLTGKGLVFAAGLRWAIANGMSVVSLSLSTGRSDYFSVFHELADEAYFAGVMLVCAMNNVPGPTYPSQYAAVFSVAAHDGTDPLSLDINPRPPVEFGAPGIDLEVPWLDGGSIRSTSNSFAPPHIAGLVARILSKHPGLTPFEVKTVLRAVADNAQPAPHTSNGRSANAPAATWLVLRSLPGVTVDVRPDLTAQDVTLHVVLAGLGVGAAGKAVSRHVVLGGLGVGAAGEAVSRHVVLRGLGDEAVLPLMVVHRSSSVFDGSFTAGTPMLLPKAQRSVRMPTHALPSC